MEYDGKAHDVSDVWFVLFVVLMSYFSIKHVSSHSYASS